MKQDGDISRHSPLWLLVPAETGGLLAAAGQCYTSRCFAFTSRNGISEACIRSSVQGYLRDGVNKAYPVQFLRQIDIFRYRVKVSA
jgi:hypothetical protein